MPDIPEKPFFRVNEVCRLTDTQPYVLRFWESEFPQLAPDRGKGSSPVYRKDDVELIFRIKQLLYEEEYTIAGARQVLSGEGAKGRTAARSATVTSSPEPPQERVPRQRALGLEDEAPAPATATQALGERPAEQGIPKERYDDAVEEITHLRLQVSDLETRLRRVDHERDHALAEAERLRDKSERAVGRLEALLQRLQELGA